MVEILFHRLAVGSALVPALGGTLLLLVHGRRPAASTAAVLVLTLGGSLGLITALPLAMHYAGIPVTAANLAMLHWLVFGVVWGVTRIKRPAAMQPVGVARPAATPYLEWRRLQWEDNIVQAVLPLAVALLVVILFFPYTHLAGIDTYRWQNLATLVIREQQIPWMVHPLGLFGFTPYAYPAAHPLLLTTVRLLGGLGVEGSWYVVSLFTMTLSISAMTWLAQAVARSARGPAGAATTWALWMGVFYGLSPVMVRYGHWATGRGLFMALLPLAMLALVERSRWRAWVGLAFASLGLLLCHKTAWVAVPLLIVSRLAVDLLPGRNGRSAADGDAGVVQPVGSRHPVRSLGFVVVLFGFSALVAGLAWRPSAWIGGPLRVAVTRLGWMAPVLWPALGIVAAGRLGPRRGVVMLLMLSVPLVLLPDMYGALIATAPVILVIGFAARDLRTRWMPMASRDGAVRNQIFRGRERTVDDSGDEIGLRVGASSSSTVLVARSRPPCFPWSLRQVCPAALILALALSLAGAVTIVVMRSRTAMTPALRAAAGFLERNDPRGPYRLDAPGRLTGQLRAYVGGSPPIAVYGTTAVRRARGLDRPGVRGPAAWIARLRRAGRIEVPDMVWTDPEWPVYYVRVGGHNRVPEDAIRIYDQDGVTIYRSETQ